MNGHILHGTNIAVDYWKIRGKRQDFIHFLTHVHGDHIVGLASSWTKPIYCSEFTAQILKIHYGISPSLLQICPVNQSIIVSSSQTFSVTAFDANHCPGAVMFYFEGNFGNILYTGDFRTCRDVIENYYNLTCRVDLLYLDNTFCDPKCIFPPREECYNEILNIAREHPEHDIVIGVRKLGKESLLARLAVDLDETICVSPMCYQIVQMLYTSQTNVFTTKSLSDSPCRLRTVPMQQITRNFMDRLNQVRPTIAIIPTAIYTGLNCQPFCREPSVYVIPYSDHSSHSELTQFVSAVKPKKIVPIVTSARGPFGLSVGGRTEMSCFSSFLSPHNTMTQEPRGQSQDYSMLLTGHNSRREARSRSALQCHFETYSLNSCQLNDSARYLPPSGDHIARVSPPNKRKHRKRLCNHDFICKKKPRGVIYEDSSVNDGTDEISRTTTSTPSNAKDGVLSDIKDGKLQYSSLQTETHVSEFTGETADAQLSLDATSGTQKVTEQTEESMSNSKVIQIINEHHYEVKQSTEEVIAAESETADVKIASRMYSACQKVGPMKSGLNTKSLHKMQGDITGLNLTLGSEMQCIKVHEINEIAGNRLLFIKATKSCEH